MDIADARNTMICTAIPWAAVTGKALMKQKAAGMLWNIRAGAP